MKHLDSVNWTTAATDLPAATMVATSAEKRPLRRMHRLADARHWSPRWASDPPDDQGGMEGNSQTGGSPVQLARIRSRDCDTMVMPMTAQTSRHCSRELLNKATSPSQPPGTSTDPLGQPLEWLQSHLSCTAGSRPLIPTL